MATTLDKLFLYGGVSTFWMYILPSGGLQPGFVFFIFGLIFSLRGQSSLIFDSTQWVIIFVLTFCASINLYHAIIYDSLDFVPPVLQSAFILILVFYVYRQMSGDRIDLLSLGRFLEACVYVNLVIFLSGLGRYDFEPRFNGFLNDPNQFAFFILCFTATAIGLTGFRRTTPALLGSAVVLLIASQSRSGLLGFFLWALSLLFSKISRSLVAVLVTLLGVVLFYVLSELIFDMIFDDGFEAIARIVVTDLQFEFWQRGFYRLVEFPGEIFFGAGKGLDGRFGYEGLEIHSTPVAILFYYGITAFVIFYFLYAVVFIRANSYGKALLAGVFGYSLTTYSFRTPLFWFVFILAATALSSRVNTCGPIFTSRSANAALQKTPA